MLPAGLNVLCCVGRSGDGGQRFGDAVAASKPAGESATSRTGQLRVANRDWHRTSDVQLDDCSSAELSHYSVTLCPLCLVAPHPLRPARRLSALGGSPTVLIPIGPKIEAPWAKLCPQLPQHARRGGRKSRKPRATFNHGMALRVFACY